MELIASGIVCGFSQAGFAGFGETVGHSLVLCATQTKNLFHAPVLIRVLVGQSNNMWGAGNKLNFLLLSH